MLAEAARLAVAAGITTVRWVRARAEDLPGDLGPFTVVTLAQSFHWMDRPRVARLLRGVLAPDGVLVHLHATTHRGVDGGGRLPHPRPPRRQIDELVAHYLGPHRRAGQRTVPDVPAGPAAVGVVETGIYRDAGFTGPRRTEVAGHVVERTADEIVAGVFSLSSAAPHLFADRLPDFEADLRALLHTVTPDGLFSERMPPATIDVWQPDLAAEGSPPETGRRGQIAMHTGVMAIEVWWPRLQPATRAWLVANNGDAVPAPIVEEIVHAGGPGRSDAWWVAQDGSADARMPDAAIDWIEEIANEETPAAW
jgi:Methyltransferase domain